MSIITDALRKAERERYLQDEISAESAQSRTALEAVRESDRMVSEALASLERRRKEMEAQTRPQVPEQNAAFFLGSSRTRSQSRDVLTFVAIAGAIAFVLYWIPRWPTTYKFASPTRTNAFHMEEVLAPAPIESLWKDVGSPFGVEGERQTIPFVLSGISAFGDERYAFINGKILGVGDFIDGAFVKSILDHEVVLETKTGEIKLKTG